MSIVSLDYLVVGHVTRDLVEGGYLIGGTASYSSRAGRALCCRVGVLTSASLDLDLTEALDGVLVACIPAATTTTFENTYIDGIDTRQQRIYGFAELLVPEMVPLAWRPSVVHLGPIARECADGLVDAFGDAFVGLTPQGWLRQWDDDGRISPCEWAEPEMMLGRADAVVLSEVDVLDASQIETYERLTRLLVVTNGAKGCTVYADGARHEFPADPVPEVDPTGAGDIFATAFFIMLNETGDLAVSARFANCFAAPSVTRTGLAGTPSREEVERCRRLLASEESPRRC